MAYFGSDGPWTAIKARAARRRNTAILEAFANNELVARVVVFNYVLRFQLIRPLWASLLKTQSKVEDVFITNVFPERWGAFWQRCNRWLMEMMIRWQTASLKGFELVDLELLAGRFHGGPASCPQGHLGF